MWKLSNGGRRAFIVKAESVISGGEKIPQTADVAINPGTTVEVEDACGEFLSTYSEVKVISKAAGKKKEKRDVMESAGTK